MSWRFACFCFVLSLSSFSKGQECKDDSGETVDCAHRCSTGANMYITPEELKKCWTGKCCCGIPTVLMGSLSTIGILAYKSPVLKNQNFLIRKGLGYIYITSKDSSANWQLSSKSINDSSSFLGQTLGPLYKESADELFYLMYNDEPPTVPGSTMYGHSKGVVVTNGKTGFWLIHSSPKFPIEPITIKKINDTLGVRNSTTKNKYFFPSTAARFGQSFLCITLPASQMNNVGVNLQYIRPKIYSVNIPDKLGEKYRNLTEAAKKGYVKKGPWFHKTTLKSSGGREFISYAKAKEFDKDLYSNWLAEDLQSDLQVETWSNGPNELPSNCRTKYHVMDIKDVRIKAKDNITLEFKNSQDHSKWAVTTNSNNTIVCVGDINRMLAQFKRGGGTVCYKNAFVWKKYSNSVADVQPCSYSKPPKKATTEKPKTDKSKGDSSKSDQDKSKSEKERAKPEKVKTD